MLNNIVFGTLLIFAGVNVPVAALPAWMQAVAGWLPLTHGIAAARLVAGGATVADISDLLVQEAALGLLYVILGLAVLRLFERESRRVASLERY